MAAERTLDAGARNPADPANNGQGSLLRRDLTSGEWHCRSARHWIAGERFAIELARDGEELPVAHDAFEGMAAVVAEPQA